MKAYKCDRCGKLFEHYNFQGTPEFLNITRNPQASGNCLDLCPNCNSELQEWVANDKEQVKSEYRTREAISKALQLWEDNTEFDEIVDENGKWHDIHKLVIEINELLDFYED